MREHTQLGDELVLLVYELLDADDDTCRLATEPARQLAWTDHLEYLRALQRKVREMVAAAQVSAGGMSLSESASVPGPESL